MKSIALPLKSVVLAFCCLLLLQPAFAQIKINEYSAANKNVAANNGEFYDWIELYNAGSSAVNVGGWYLSDNINNLIKWQIPAGLSINAGAFRLIYCSGRNGVFGGQYNTNFKLTQSDTSEYIILTNSGGVIQDSTKIYPNQRNQSHGRSTNGAATWSVFTSSTPGTSNNAQTAYLNYVPMVQFNLAPGFYSGTQSVTLSCPQSNVTIRYTTNGAIPTTSSTLYSGPISVATTKCIRARAFDNGTQYAPSFTETNTYFINETHTLPVMALASDSFTYLFNSTKPVIQGNMEYFSAAGQFVWEIEGDYNPHGNDSWAYPQKGVDFNVEDEYGRGVEINKKMFYTSSRKKFNWLILKAAASDNFPGNAGSHPAAHIRDAYDQTLAEKFNLNLDVRRMDHCLVFINGQYWGVYEYRERVDADYFDHYYDQQEQYVDNLQYWGGMNVKLGSDTAWNNLYYYVTSHNMAVPAYYQYVTDRLDIMSLIDMVILGTYTVNSDWLNWNTAWWRGRKTPNNVKWKYWLWDTDNIFNLGENYSQWPTTNNTADPCDIESANGGGPDFSDPSIGPAMGHIVIFNALRQNQIFNQIYINRYADLINTAFNCTNMLNHLDTMIARIQPEMQRQCTRWSGNYNQWVQNVQFLRNQISGRCNTISGGITNCYNVTGPYPVKVNVYPACAGKVKVNSLIPDEYPFSGTYYGGVNQSLKAYPASGWQFDHWQMVHTANPNTTTDSIWFDLGTTGDSIVAVFTQVNPQPGILYVNIKGQNPGTVTINGSPVADNSPYVYTLGTQLNVQATPVPGCTFYKWEANHSLVYPNDTAESGYFCFREADTLKVIFDDCSVVPDSLTVLVQQPGFGTVTINSLLVPTPITVPMNAGTLLNIVATPTTNYTFSHWQIAHHTIAPNSNAATASFTFQQRDTLIAIFLPPDTMNLTVMVNPAGGGNVSVNGTTPASYPTVMKFVNGTPLTAVATAAGGYSFTNWSILHHTLAPNNSAATVNFTITQHDTLVANFTVNPNPPDTFNLTVLVNPLAGGNVSVNGTTPPAYPAVLKYVDGTLINLQATANGGYTFANYTLLHHTLSPNNTTANANFIITQNDTLLATFTLNPPDTFDLTVMVNPLGGGNVSLNGTTPPAYPAVLKYVDGTLINLQAVANGGFTFTNWTILHHTLNPNNTSANASFTITQNDTLLATFTANPQPDTFDLTVMVTPIGGGNVSVNSVTPPAYPTVMKFVDGTLVNVAATANGGYTFTNWTLLHHALAPNNTTANASFVITQNDTLLATFTANPNPPDTFKLTVLVNPAGGGNVSINGTALSTYPSVLQLVDGTLVSASETPNGGFAFSNWTLLHHTLSPNNGSVNASFTIHQDDTLVANYNVVVPVRTLVLQTVPANSGIMVVNGTTYTSFPTSLSINDGTAVSASQTPNSGFLFTNWNLVAGTLNPNNTANPVNFTVTQNDTLYAYYSIAPPDTYAIVVNVMPNIFAGDVTVAGVTPVNHQYPAVFYFPKGTNVDFSATGLNNYTFSHYQFLHHGPVPNSSAPVVFINVQHPDTVTAYFNEGKDPIDSVVQVLIPSGFSPDGDGVNDEFRVFLRPDGHMFTEYSMQIYNRWGQRVFESNLQSHGWSGYFGTQKCDIGVYSYMLVGKLETGEEILKKGTVTLIR
ncbi:MAG: CotH kinase family protein [Chitinophagales bacterium]